MFACLLMEERGNKKKGKPQAPIHKVKKERGRQQEKRKEEKVGPNGFELKQLGDNPAVQRQDD